MILFPFSLFAQSTDYFPAHIDDIFIYESHDYESDYITYDTTIVTNVIQKVDGGIDIYYNNSNQPRYYKASNGNIFQYFNNTPYLWYDFTTASQDTFETELYGSQLFVVVYYGGSSMFGKNISARSFTFYSKNSYSANACNWLGKGMGPIETNSYISYPSVSSLVGCIIDGKRYGTLVGIKDEELNNNYELFQNYPNPFNPVTTISYSLPEQTHVRIKVFDVLGREVTELTNGLNTPGEHKVVFDGTNLSSGVYYYSIKTSKYSKTKKLVLLK